MRAPLLLVISSIIVISCSDPKTDLKAEEANIMKTDSTWSALAKEGTDAEKILSYWTDDAVLLSPGQPLLRGKDALRKMVQDSKNIPGFSISWKSSEVQFSPDGKMAYMYGENLVTINDSTGKQISIPGRGYTVWRKQTDGSWKCAVDLWNNP
jgi:ketosteroid isomerase-like protein